MAIVLKPKTIKALKSGEVTVEEFTEKLVKTYSVYDIAQAYSELLSSSDAAIATPKIPITDEMLKEHFRIIGTSPRGRKKKVEE